MFPKLHFKPDYSRLFVQLWFHFQTQPSHDLVESLKATRSDDPLNRICLFPRSLCSILPTGEEVYSMARLRVLALVLLVSCIVVIASAEKTDQEAEHGGKRLAYRFYSSFFFFLRHSSCPFFFPRNCTGDARAQHYGGTGGGNTATKN